MKTTAFLVGLTTVGMGAIAPGAIANDSPAPSLSMADLEMPVLENEISPTAVTDAPQVSEVLPAGEFSDVSPTHWAYGAVNDLAANYGCITGYPDGTFRGEQLVTRYEFAAALDSCLGAVMQQIEAQPQADVDAILEDLTELQNELGDLSGDVEAVESEVKLK